MSVRGRRRVHADDVRAEARVAEVRAEVMAVARAAKARAVAVVAAAAAARVAAMSVRGRCRVHGDDVRGRCRIPKDCLLLQLVPADVLGVLQIPEVDEVFKLDVLRAVWRPQYKLDVVLYAKVQEIGRHVRATAITCDDALVVRRQRACHAHQV